MLADSALTMSYSDHMHYCSVRIVYFVQKKSLVYIMMSLIVSWLMVHAVVK